SAQAAKEIKTLINASVERVEQGTALVDRAGSTMLEVVSSVKRVSDIVAEISAASAEQSQGVAQVGEAVTQMDQATQQNAALVEESAAAAASLRTQAEQLVQAVAVFRFSQDAVAASAPVSMVTATQPLAVRAHANTAFAGADRRSADRATNVTRLKPAAAAKAAVKTTAKPAKPFKPAAPAQRTGTDDWESF
ncbi:MAG: methyl-accepting chemotaxis protein, partial [Rhodoferax sp.]|nr:methyl-accepting chemotaxis protein [Rhodoferax sp.]